MGGPTALLHFRQMILRLVTAVALTAPMVPGATTAARSYGATSGIQCGAWTIVSSPPSSTPTAYLEGVGGSAGNDVWAVGHHSDYSGAGWQGLFRHWNGRSWTSVPGPAGRGRFYAVAAVSRTDAWAVGEGPEIAHWNGKAWSIVPSPRVTFDPREPASLRGVAAISATNVWAIGLNWHVPTGQLIEHWNGRNWRVVPDAAAGQHPLSGIAALSATDMWAVGKGIEHWTGAQWRLVPSPAEASAITAVAPDNIWAAGGSTVQHWDGTAWTVVSTPSSHEQFTTLTGMTHLSADDVWTVGYVGHTVPHDGYAEHPFVLHWDGSAWHIVSTPATRYPDSQLLAVTSVSPRTVWAVGFAGMHREGDVHTLIERFDRC